MFHISQERVAHMKAQLLSRRVWDILHAVPLNPTLLEAFQDPVEPQLPGLLNPASPQHLMYSLHIVDKLSMTGVSSPPASPHKGATLKSITSSENPLSPEEDKVEKESWSQLFIRNGGLRHLYDILMSGM